MAKDHKHKVVIGVPVAEILHAKTAFSLAHAFRGLSCPADLVMVRSCDIIGNRVQLVQKARDFKATHLMFIDHDMFFPTDKANPIQQLLDDDKDIVGGWYNFRTREKPEPVGSPLTEASETELFKCNVIGTGFMLVKMEVFDKIPQPWFSFGRKSDGTLAYGEDSWFCQQAIKAGYDVWADPRIYLKHLGEQLF